MGFMRIVLSLPVTLALVTAVVPEPALADITCSPIAVGDAGRIVIKSFFEGYIPVCYQLPGQKSQKFVIKIENGVDLDFDISLISPGATLSNGITRAKRTYILEAEEGQYRIFFGSRHPEIGQRYELTFSVTVLPMRDGI